MHFIVVKCYNSTSWPVADLVFLRALSESLQKTEGLCTARESTNRFANVAGQNTDNVSSEQACRTWTRPQIKNIIFIANVHSEIKKITLATWCKKMNGTLMNNFSSVHLLVTKNWEHIQTWSFTPDGH